MIGATRNGTPPTTPSHLASPPWAVPRSSSGCSARRDQGLPHRAHRHGHCDLRRYLPLLRIFNSWVEAFEVVSKDGSDYMVELTGTPINDAYRYVDWLLTVPLLLLWP